MLISKFILKNSKQNFLKRKILISSSFSFNSFSNKIHSFQTINQNKRNTFNFLNHNNVYKFNNFENNVKKLNFSTSIEKENQKKEFLKIEKKEKIFNVKINYNSNEIILFLILKLF